MAEADWDEVTYLRKKPQRAADAKSQKVSGPYNYVYMGEVWEMVCRALTKLKGEAKKWTHQKNVLLLLTN